MHEPAHTSEDNPVDGVDNPAERSRKVAETGGSPGTDTPSRTESNQPRGSDIARQALQAARAKAAGNGATGANGAKKTGKGTAKGGRRARRRWSGPRADDRDPQPLGRLASRIAVDRDWTRSLTGGRLFANWAELVGADIAEHVTPERLDGTELIVRADSTAWATQLRLLQRQLLARLATALGDGVVTAIRVAGPSAPSWRYGPRHVRGRGPRDTYG